MDIVRQIRKDAEKGVKILEHEFKERLMVIALRLCTDHSEAEALVWRTIDETVRHIGSLNNPDSLFSWMSSIMVRINSSSSRRMSNSKISCSGNPPEASDEMAGVDRLVSEIDSEILHKAVDGLPDKLRESIVLHYFMDIPLLQIAKILSVPKGTVASRLRLARIALAEKLGGQIRRHAVACLAIGFALFASAATLVAVATGAFGGRDSGETSPAAEPAASSTAEPSASPAASPVVEPAASPAAEPTAEPDAADAASPAKDSRLTSEAKKVTAKISTLGGRLAGACAAAAIALAAPAEEESDDAYIESDGTAYIKTAYHLKPNSRVELDFALTSTADADTTDKRIFGNDSTASALGMSGSLWISKGASDSFFRIHTGNGTTTTKDHWITIAPSTYQTIDTARHTVTLDYPAGQLYFTSGSDEYAVNNQISGYANACTQPVGLFCRINSSGNPDKLSKARIYSFKAYEYDAAKEDYVLAAEYVPCIKDGLLGFKDLETGEFFSHAKADTALSYGGDILIDGGTISSTAYVATPVNTSMKLYIDTRYYATENTRLELDYSLLDARPAGETWYLFAGLTRFCGYLNDNGFNVGVASGWGNASICGKIANEPNVRRTVILDLPNRIYSFNTAGYINDKRGITNVAAYAETSTIKIGSAASAMTNHAAIAVYGCRIYESGTLVRDFTPCWIDGTPGLRDSITGAFATYDRYESASNGAKLDYGGDISAVYSPYVETRSACSQYIDTGYIPQPGTKCEVDYSMSEKRPSGTKTTWNVFRGRNAPAYFGAYNNDSGFGCINTASGWKSGIVGSDVSDAVFVRRTAVLDNVANVGALVTFGYTNGWISTANASGTAESDQSIKIAANSGASVEFASMRVFACRIWENGEQVHDFRPAVKNGVAGLQDALSERFAPVESKGSSNPYVYGGVFPVTVASSKGTVGSCKITYGKTVTLTATALGATMYRWTKNGEPLPQGEGVNGELVVGWRKGAETDVYEVVAVYAPDSGVTAESAPAQYSVVNTKTGFSVSVQ